MKRVLLVNWEKCIGCRTCEMICSLLNEERSNPTEARITVIKFEEKGADFPVYCQNCEAPACEAICPAKAIYKDDITGAVLVDIRRCIGCRMCILACPIGGLSFHPAKKVIIKCDLCKGDPACVKYCPEGALEVVSLDAIGVKRRRENIRKFSSYLDMMTGGKE